ncbi:MULTISPECIES: ComEC/Rec2 family competence protein [Paenarthrobacter]|uniref:ComEC/Rec2 family competence protein n=1 Tax=Paenarthrobacter TaxID=1742992 RepID=UPI00074D357A|nr:ComEC/Rec2 family competence protein [Paenarthrobacter ureafaciens]AMB40695.1 competence protein ComEC [Arthrobacter sp. ATCC 21022]RWW99045.1 ComEC/Rec2 family competence protein [Paenarthrobacter ureafaciens]
MAESSDDGDDGRLDVRLVPAVIVVWATALAGTTFLRESGAALTALLSAGAAALLLAGPLRRKAGGMRGKQAGRGRTLPVTLAVACLLGAAVALHCTVDAAKRESGPLAAAVSEGHPVVIQVRVAGIPAPVPAPGGSGEGRWMLQAELENLTAHGSKVSGTATLTVLGNDAWKDVRPGQSVRTTGIPKEPRPGEPDAATLSASTGPTQVGTAFDPKESAARARERFSQSAAELLEPDPAGLLPGMVVGDTSTLPASLKAAMETCGMTHLTAVSGSNCSLILAGFILLARSLRLSRPLAAIVAVVGLAAFVLLVGPDPSVLRASVMGSVGLVALTTGHRGRSLSFLCLATTALLLISPGLAVSFGFLLSVLATLGIVLLARRLTSWFPRWVPRWLAAGVSVPLSAQLACGPVIVLVQPQLSPYALAANVVAGIFVAPVTILGTLAVPVSALVPWLAPVLFFVAGNAAAAVAATARYFAGLPGSGLPWADGPVGVSAMVLLSALTLFGTWAVLHPTGVMVGVRGVHQRLVRRLKDWEVRNGARPGGPITFHRKRRSKRGRLESCKHPSGRNPQWLLPKIPGTRARPGPRALRRTASAGVTRRPPR